MRLPWSWVERGLLVGLAAVVFWLARDAEASRGREVTLNRKLREPWRGNAMATFSTRSVQGDSVTVARMPVGSKQLVYVFRTTCPFCRRSNPYVNALQKSFDSAAAAGGVPVLVVGISLDSLADTERYVKEQRLSFPVVRFPERKLRLIYKSQVVPSLMLLTDEGRVIYARLGVFETPAARDSLFRAALALPPMRDSQSAGSSINP